MESRTNTALKTFFPAFKYNAEKEQKNEWEAKQKELARIEEAKKAEEEKGTNVLIVFVSFVCYVEIYHQTNDNENVRFNYDCNVSDKKKDEKSDSFAEKMATQVIKNLQIKVSNIHIRYEDRFTNPAKPFSIGITLKNLAFQV